MYIVSCIENNWETLIGVNLKTNYGKKDIYASKGRVKPTNTFVLEVSMYYYLILT
jgi:hypothetical protein